MNENLTDVLENWFTGKMEQVHTILPGKIVKYEGHGTRKATVKPLVKLAMRKGEPISIQPIDNVPVIFPSSADFSLLFQLNDGDGCLLLFSEASIGNYLNNTEEVDPEDSSRFSLTDCICLPGLFSFGNVPTSSSTIEIDAQGKINIKANSDVIINEGTQGAARKEDEVKSTQTEDAAFWAFITAFFNVITGTPIPEPGNGSPSALQTALAAAITAAGGVPSSITGKITAGSGTVKVGD